MKEYRTPLVEIVILESESLCLTSSTSKDFEVTHEGFDGLSLD